MESPASNEEAAALREYLATRDVPCPSCGYNLRSLAAPSCPECNQPLGLRVNLLEPRVGAWIAALLPLLGSAGTAAIITLFALASRIKYGGSVSVGTLERWLLEYLPPIVCLVAAAAVLALVRSRGRRWFRGTSSGYRQVVIFLCYLLPIAYVGLLVYMIAIQ